MSWDKNVYIYVLDICTLHLLAILFIVGLFLLLWESIFTCENMNNAVTIEFDSRNTSAVQTSDFLVTSVSKDKDFCTQLSYIEKSTVEEALSFKHRLGWGTVQN